MTIFAYWSATPSAPPRQAELVGVWYRRTLEQGHTPRLLTARDALKSRGYKVAVKRGDAHQVSIETWAMLAKRAKALVSLCDFEQFL